ncbi:uncharacterized protein F5Z01DRAFT_552465 [Emericellopsis atlantica]|uniref:Uncharacterized protein n=1 Tax=Emericellopsis atlantica TaxID=2614577 RepID=A0A9P7ZPA4_9HYPO|nr:uncharacterized protein F5Z01DRAFT_552465 [Emericellopsis atlantica]KAG9255685.1 hypothetical protein F5Z01DRAFT_552465 [Emericellopsis atlantica]
MAAPTLPQPSGDGAPTTIRTREQIIVEAWGQGFNVGALVFILLTVLCNYRRNVLLHKLILLELVLALGHGFFIFSRDPAYGWTLSSTAVALYVSYNIHNVVAWIKIKPFLPRWGGRFFIFSLVAVQPYWVLEVYANFAYFNHLGQSWFEWTRYFEPLARDPWWIFTTVKLVLVIRQNYEYSILGLVRTSPRFGIMLLCMLLSIVFVVIDVVATALISAQSGINPYWRLALVFKCASDAIFLDDFKSVLDKIAESALKYVANLPSTSKDGGFGSAQVVSGRRYSGPNGHAVGCRRPSAAQRPRHFVQISSHSNSDDTGTGYRDAYGREYLPSRAGSSRPMRGIDETPLSPDGQILAETTIEVSGNDLTYRNSNASGDDRAGSQELILSDGSVNNTPHDYGWGEPPRLSSVDDDVERGIPMRPMRAKTADRGVGLGL